MKSRSSERAEQMFDLFLDIFRSGHGLPDVLVEQLAVSLSHPEHSHLDRSLFQAQGCSGLGIGNFARAFLEIGAQGFIEMASVAAGILVAQLRLHMPQQDRGPTPVEYGFRSQFVGGKAGVSRFRLLGVDGVDVETAAALQCRGLAR